MQTNQVMHRSMGVYDVQQRTKDGYFNATDLLRQWNDSVENGNLHPSYCWDAKQKRLDIYLENKSTQEYLETIKREENTDKPYITSRASRGENAGTWMHPMLFIDFAMWLNPKFKYEVIKFVRDELLRYRDELGDRLNDFKALLKAKGIESEPFDWIKFNASFKKRYLTKGNAEINRSKFEEIRDGVAGYIELSALVKANVLKTMNDIISHIAVQNRLPQLNVS